jgi:2'-5' RNA ligase
VGQSALIVTVEEAEPVVGDLRQRLDPAAQEGLPPHITLLFPFADPRAITARTVASLREAIRGFPPFFFRLSEVARFPGTLYLSPKPADPFTSLTKALVAAFPDFPPYGGRFSDVVPHLTVAQGTETQLTSAASELAAKLASHGSPRSTCRTLDLIENASGRWRLMHQIPLVAS